MSDKFMKTALLFVLFMASAPGVVLGQAIEKKGTTPYVTHFIFRPLMSIDIPGLGKATNLEGGWHHPKHEGREDARQDVGTMRGAEHGVGRQEVHRRRLRVD